MELIKEIKDTDNSDNFKLREACRAILFDEENKMPLLFVSKYDYYKLPGGGIDEGENKEEALKREAMEEVGSEIEILKEVGKTIEVRENHQLKQTSYCYIGKILSKGQVDFTEKEINDGFELIWTTLDDAIEKVKNSNPKCYEGEFIQKRDFAILEKVKQYF